MQRDDRRRPGRKPKTVDPLQSAWVMNAVQRYCLRGSASDVQQDAAAIIEDIGDTAPPGYRTLATLGAGGTQPSHCQRDLHRMDFVGLDRACLPEISYFDILVKDDTPGACGLTTKRCGIIYPHDWLAALNRNKELFKYMFLGPPGRLEAFWELEKNLPSDRLHIRVIQQATDKCIPLVITGDDAERTEYDSVLILQMHSLLVGENAAIDSCLVCCTVPLAWVASGITLEMVYERFTWSLYNCFLNVRPHVDFDGQPLRGGGEPLTDDGYSATDAFIVGDWKWEVEALNFRGYRHKSCCAHCTCLKSGNDPEMWFCNFSPLAGWHQTLITNLQYEMGTPENKRMPLSYTPGFDLWRVWCDTMHSNCLGSNWNLNGNVLWTTCVAGAWGNFLVKDADSLLGVAHAHYKQFALARKIPDRIAKFSYSRLGKPTLRTQCPSLPAKAAQTRGMVRWSLHLAEKFNSHSTRDELRYGACWGMVRYYDIIYGCGFILSENEIEQLKTAGLTFLQCYGELRRLALQDRLALWSCIPKMHQFQHLLEEFVPTTHLNPRFLCCYRDESMIGIVKRIAKHSQVASCSSRTLERLLLYLRCRWAKCLLAGTFDRPLLYS